MTKRKIFDCFLFFNELDMLKMRFEELKDVVDISYWLNRDLLSVDSQSLYISSRTRIDLKITM